MGEVMPRGLFSTPPMRPHGSGLRTKHRVEVDEDLPSSSQETVWTELSVSSGVGHTAVAASQQRPEFSAYIETIPENMSELLGDDQEELDEILKQSIMVFQRNQSH